MISKTKWIEISCSSLVEVFSGAHMTFKLLFLHFYSAFDADVHHLSNITSRNMFILAIVKAFDQDLSVLRI